MMSKSKMNPITARQPMATACCDFRSPSIWLCGFHGSLAPHDGHAFASAATRCWHVRHDTKSATARPSSCNFLVHCIPAIRPTHA
jgi:hypothetical protein